MQPDLRLYLTASDITILKKSTELIAIFSGGNDVAKQDILASGTYDRRPLETYIGALIHFSAISDPANNPLAKEYRSAFQKNFTGYNPMRKTNWADSAHPLELFFYRSSEKVHKEMHDKLHLVVTDTSPIKDPYEEERKKYQQQYQQAMDAQSQAAEQATMAALSAQVKPKSQPRPEPTLPEKETTSEVEITEAERLEKTFLFFKDNPNMSHDDRRQLLETLGVFDSESIEVLLTNPTLLRVPVFTDKEGLQKWRNSLTAQIKQAKNKQEASLAPKVETPQPIPIPTPSPSLTHSSPAETVPLVKRPKATIGGDAQAVKRRVVTIWQKGINRIKRDTVPTASTASESTVIATQKISHEAQSAVAHGAEILASKIRTIVHEHPTSTTTIATGIVGGLLGLLFRIPFPIGFLGGAAGAQIVMRTATQGKLGGISPMLTDSVDEEPSQSLTSSNATQLSGGDFSNNAASSVIGGVRSTSFIARLLRGRFIWLTILLLIGFTFLFVLVYQFSAFPPYQSFDTQAPTTSTNSDIKVTKTGPESVEKYMTGDRITYTITVTNLAGNAITAEVVDKLPQDTTFADAIPSGFASGGTVKWTLNLAAGATESIKLDVFVNKNLIDTWVVNSVSGTGVSSGGKETLSGACPSAEDISANRKDIASCKGLNPAISLADTSITDDSIKQFISKYGRGSSEFEQRTYYIVETAKRTGINPALILGLWRSESNFGNNLGCRSLPSVFETQVQCATGASQGGSVATKCAVSKDVNSPGCKLAAGILKSNPEIYAGEYAFNVPIATLDDFMKLYGPFNPQLAQIERSKGIPRPISENENNNCRHSYNVVLEVALGLGSCKPNDSTPGSTIINSNLAQCKFYRNDQTSAANCPPSDQGFRCEQAITFKSSLLLSYIENAAKKTGVPAQVLAAFVRVESTVPQKYSATKKSYSISDYSDADVLQMKNPLPQFDDIDATIGNSNKAICPRSTTGAIGIMQIQPPEAVHTAIYNSVQKNNQNKSRDYTVPPPDQYKRSEPQGLDAGARAIGKTKTTLTLDDFCDPQKNLILAAHVFFGKKNVTSWNAPNDTAGYQSYITTLAESYYGNDAQTGAYGNSVWRSVEQCKIQ